MCRLRNIAMRDYQESVTTGQTDRQTDRRTDGRTDRQPPDKVIPMCRYASQATQKLDQTYELAAVLNVTRYVYDQRRLCNKYQAFQFFPHFIQPYFTRN